MLAVAVEKVDPLGESRRQAGDRGKALAGKCTLNRLELSGAEADGQERYKKIVMDEDRMEGWMVDAFLAAHDTAPEEIVLDMDATDDPIHGQQEGRFFHGYYRRYCYLPLYIFCGEHLLCARLRRSNIDGADGAVDELKRIIGQIRHSWPEVSIIIRADSGFCRDDLLLWCADHHVDYVIGFAKNARLKREIAAEMSQAEVEFKNTGKPARVFKDFRYRTRRSWSCEKSRLRRSLAHLRGVMRRMRHLPVREQVHNLNRVLRGHYAYYGIAGNLRALQHVARAVERYWRQMLSSRSRAGFVRWEVFNRIQLHFPLQRPKLALRYREFQSLAVL